MRRGSTPLHTFTLSIDTAELLKIRITYHQLGRCVLTKTEKDATLDGYDVSVRLSEKETLAFRCSQDVDIQIKVLTKSGDVIPSDPLRVDVESCLDDEVMT